MEGQLLHLRGWTRKPLKNRRPGLVYDITVDDFIGKIYGQKGSIIITWRLDVSCSKVKQKSAGKLNLPSMVAFRASSPWTMTSIVTNLGLATWDTAKTDISEAVTVKVLPPTLSFATVGEKKTFDVSIGWSGRPSDAHNVLV